MHKCIYWFKFQKCQKNFIMGLKDTVFIYMYPKFHACSINRSISIEFLNKLCSGVKFTFCAHMKQILLSNVLFHCCNILLIQISNISYSPRIVCTKISLWYPQKNTQITICKMSLFLRLLYTFLDNQYTIDLVISGITSLKICSCYSNFK